MPSANRGGVSLGFLGDAREPSIGEVGGTGRIRVLPQLCVDETAL